MKERPGVVIIRWPRCDSMSLTISSTVNDKRNENEKTSSVFGVCVCHQGRIGKMESRVRLPPIAMLLACYRSYRAFLVFGAGSRSGSWLAKNTENLTSDVLAFIFLTFLSFLFSSLPSFSFSHNSFRQHTHTHIPTLIFIMSSASSQSGWPSCRNIQIRANFPSAIMAIMILIVSGPHTFFPHSFLLLLPLSPQSSLPYHRTAFEQTNVPSVLIILCSIRSFFNPLSLC